MKCSQKEKILNFFSLLKPFINKYSKYITYCWWKWLEWSFGGF